MTPHLEHYLTNQIRDTFAKYDMRLIHLKHLRERIESGEPEDVTLIDIVSSGSFDTAMLAMNQFYTELTDLQEACKEFIEIRKQLKK